MSVPPSPYVLSEEKIVFDGKWIRTRQVKFRCPNGTEGIWESSHRTSRPPGCPVDGVDVIGILREKGRSQFVFVKQYRIPVGGWCLEFPAGLIDSNESVVEAAIRELKEETGYSARNEDVVYRSSGAQPLSPGLSDDSAQFVMVNIDGERHENRLPQQKLDQTEVISVVLVDCDRILEYLQSIEKEIHIEAMLYSFAIGWQLSQKQSINL